MILELGIRTALRKMMNDLLVSSKIEITFHILLVIQFALPVVNISTQLVCNKRMCYY